MKILVTGGAGFIGTALLKALRQSGEFTQLVSADFRPPAQPVEGGRKIGLIIHTTTTFPPR